MSLVRPMLLALAARQGMCSFDVAKVGKFEWRLGTLGDVGEERLEQVPISDSPSVGH